MTIDNFVLLVHIDMKCLSKVPKTLQEEHFTRKRFQMRT